MEINILNFNISRTVGWLEFSPARDALYENFDILLKIISGNGTGTTTSRAGTIHRQPEDSWRNLRAWIEQYSQRRCRRISHLPHEAT
jgi:hypothetical protein